MESRNRFAVPADELDAVRVHLGEQLQELAEPRAPESSQWNGQMPHPYGDGATHADADGD
jgi:hypothetical protein